MGASYQDRLTKMRQRRLPSRSTGTFAGKFEARADSAFAADSSDVREAYETKGNGDATRYALGAMEAVDAKYTSVSLAEGERVAKQITGKLPVYMPVTTRLQGSLALDIHIRASSDVDILVLGEWFLTHDNPVAPSKSYTTLPGKTTIGELLALRQQCEAILTGAYPAATVDIGKAKSIALEGGSLARKVDVVPAHWHDTSDYQATGLEAFRDVYIFNKDEFTRQNNRPFMHMLLINHRDSESGGGGKRAIRLLKCLIRDSDRDFALSSYDVASLIYHMTKEELTVPWYLPLQLLNRVESFLGKLERNPGYARQVKTPDGTRKILNESKKEVEVGALRAELTALIEAVGTDYITYLPFYQDKALALAAARGALNDAVIK
ncbi:hypothetical protein R69658_01639 [Paraburkholderia aspalathi]|uniref:Nucleotidyltransferase n=1 Tax=Paraburkholderia aspalathi TaxID=1324617 RepID=A0ABN7L273_9BURK|nr:hypothetical protein [Paraburkholderia aspalathi]MBK3818348.1 hypothetical protein [Paraburkholderia aspalathi]MBK3830202.1 hypothetical protein [Paraburkholderia aspalathi]MBK3859360.1 hypothetical protein [Paraburkholderia aspalathi]CAE6727188.1 hypothetical protein R69658_01639 [Paraburkholderia aspalathi]